jgi:hypothetical protein
VITNFDENLIPSKPGRGVELCISIPETTSNENSIPGDSTFSDYSDRLLATPRHSAPSPPDTTRATTFKHAPRGEAGETILRRSANASPTA